MQSLSSTLISYLKGGGYYDFSIAVTPTVGSPFTITTADVLLDSLSIDRPNWSYNGDIEIGTADAAELVFTLDNSDGRWNDITFLGARLVVTLDISGTALAAGTYWIDTSPRRSTTMSIKALDGMAKFNQDYTTDLTYPATLLAVLQDCCTKCGVTLTSTSWPNSGLVVGAPTGNDISYHQVVGWVAELAGRNAWMNHDNTLWLSWYGDNQANLQLLLQPDDYVAVSQGEVVNTITGIAGKVGNATYTAGAAGYVLTIDGNPFLPVEPTAALATIHAAIGGFSWLAVESLEAQAMPQVWPGDVLLLEVDTLVANADSAADLTATTNQAKLAKITNGAGVVGANLYPTTIDRMAVIVSKHKLSAKSEIVSAGRTSVAHNYASGSTMSDAQTRVVETIATEQASAQVGQLQTTTLQLNDLINKAMGYYSTQVAIEGGGYRTYTHDAPTLAASSNIYAITEQGFAWTNSGWNGGNPVWQSGMTADGNIIGNLLSVIGIQAEWITAGRIRSTDGTTTDINLDSGSITHNANVDGKAVQVRMSATSGFEVLVDGVKRMGIDPLTGYPLVQRVIDPDRPGSFAEFGSTAGIIGLTLWDGDISEQYPWFGIGLLVDGGYTLYDRYGNHRMEIGDTGSTVWNKSSTHGIGADETGPYKIVNNAKTYL